MSQIEKPGTSRTYFFDTYALFEILNGNSNYEPYIESKGITTIFNLAEFNYNLKKERDKKVADAITANYEDVLVKVYLADVLKAMDLKTKYRKLSIPDAIGYIVAKRHNAKFLTGDNDFEGFDNVEFVK